jgi:hypothetical protein
MPLLLVTYDLDEQGKQDYPGVEEELEKFPDCCHVLQSVWLLRTSLRPTAVHKRLLPYLDRKDRLFVTQIDEEGEWSARLKDPELSWLNGG